MPSSYHSVGILDCGSRTSPPLLQKFQLLSSAAMLLLLLLLSSGLLPSTSSPSDLSNLGPRLDELHAWLFLQAPRILPTLAQQRARLHIFRRILLVLRAQAASVCLCANLSL